MRDQLGCLSTADCGERLSVRCAMADAGRFAGSEIHAVCMTLKEMSTARLHPFVLRNRVRPILHDEHQLAFIGIARLLGGMATVSDGDDTKRELQTRKCKPLISIVERARLSNPFTALKCSTLGVTISDCNITTS